MNKIKKHKIYLLMLALIIIFGITHLPKLGFDEVNPDAVNWHQRSEQYIDAIKSRDFNRTYQHYHPGVTLMLLIGAPVEILKRVAEPAVGYNRFSYEVFHFTAKYVLNIFLLVLTVLLVYNLSKVIAFKNAYLVGILLSIEPFFLGNARLLHMDALLALFVANSLVAFYIAVSKKSYNWLLIASLYLGYSFWTKSAALTAIAYCIGIAGLLFLFRKLNFKFLLSVILIVVFSFFVAGYSILPALWVNPQRVFDKMYNFSRNVVDEGHDEIFFGVESQNPGPWFYPFVLLYKISPLSLILFVISLVYVPYLFIKDVRKKKFEGNGIYYFLFLYMIGYFAAFEIASKKIDRYLVPLFPLIIIYISFVGIKIFDLIKNTKIKILVLVAVCALYIWPLITYFPYYFIYNSPMFGGNKAAGYVVGQKSFGVGVFEVRDHLYKNYGFVKVGFIDRKAMSVIYPSSMVFDVRSYGASNYQVLVLDSDDPLPKKAEGKFVYDSSIQIAGTNFWNFYVKKPGVE